MLASSFIAFTLLFLVPSNGKYNAPWGYHENIGPEYWARMYPNSACGGRSQSPIEFSSLNTEYRQFDPLIVKNLVPVNRVQMQLENNGHTLFAQMDGSEQISGGGLGNTYLASQFHFHWGKDDTIGSEHLIDGRQYPAELHIVHFNVDRFRSIGDAITQPKGLAVLGFFFEIGTETNWAFQTLVDLIRHVPYEGNSTRFVVPFDVKTLFPKSMDKYFRYDGSLTTPDCHESVVWTVFNEPIRISRRQVEAFRNVYASDIYKNAPGPVRLVDNHRPVQPINDRVVYRSFLTSGTSSCACLNIAYLAFSVILVLSHII